MREVRIALIEADVAIPVVKYFIDKVKETNIKAYESEIGLAEKFVKNWAFCVKQNYGNVPEEDTEKKEKTVVNSK